MEELRRSPVDMVNISHYFILFTGLYTCQVVKPGFLNHQQYMNLQGFLGFSGSQTLAYAQTKRTYMG